MDEVTRATNIEAAKLLGWEIADYKPQVIPAYQGNLCVEALEESLDLDGVKTVIQWLPEPNKDAASLKDNERLQTLMGLTNFMLPLTCQVQAPVAIDAMMRQGYVGRTAKSPQHVRIFHRVAEHAHGKHFRQRHDTICAQSSAALIGASGMGKTTTFKRFFARQKQVIYHPDLDVAQVTWLYVKMVSAGPGVKGLCERIIKAFDDLFPEKNYFKMFVGTGRSSASSLIHAAGFLLNEHLVGLLIVDELQNLKIVHGDNAVMTELASLCDATEVPILFVTTPKAKRILTEAARQMRRSVNMGFGNWNRLPAHEIAYSEDGKRHRTEGEWVEVVRELWKHCVLRKKRSLDDSMFLVLYECSQGIVDLTIKLFIVCEWAAIVNGHEELSESLVREVYQDYMTVIHPLIEAYKNNDTAALLKLEDVLPFDVDDCLDKLTAQYRARSDAAAATRPGQPSFQERLVLAITALGLNEEDAARLARRVQDEGKAKDMFSAMARVTQMVTPKRHKRGKPSTDAAAAASRSMPDLAGRPADLRNAFVAASANGTHVVDELVNMGLLNPNIEELLWLD